MTLTPWHGRYNSHSLPHLHTVTHSLTPSLIHSLSRQSSMIRKASEEKFSYVILQKQLKRAPLDDSHVHALRDDWTLDAADVDPGNE
jgi:hypothetical protein